MNTTLCEVDSKHYVGSKDVLDSYLPALTETRISSICSETQQIVSLKLRAASSEPLPYFSAGSHIDVHLPDGSVRQYSLCNDPANRMEYEIAVLREDKGRGGSVAIHALKVEQHLLVSRPKNFFGLAGQEAVRHLLIAGGIGITPMMAMVSELDRIGADFHLHYCARSIETAAFLDRLKPYLDAGKVSLHFDGGDPLKGLDIHSLLASYQIGTHLYFCGPPGLMSAIKGACSGWPPHVVHFEHFSAPTNDGAIERYEFYVELSGRSQRFKVPPDKSIVDVLVENGLPVATDCREGYCGACITKYTSGTPEHHDTVLSEKEREKFVMLCCARAPRGEVITIDL